MQRLEFRAEGGLEVGLVRLGGGHHREPAVIKQRQAVDVLAVGLDAADRPPDDQKNIHVRFTSIPSVEPREERGRSRTERGRRDIAAAVGASTSADADAGRTDYLTPEGRHHAGERIPVVLRQAPIVGRSNTTYIQNTATKQVIRRFCMSSVRIFRLLGDPLRRQLPPPL